MSIDQILAGLYVFSLAAFLGYQIISKVPQLLHTPLMAFTNAISGVSVVASILIAGRKSDTLVIPILGAIGRQSAAGGMSVDERFFPHGDAFRGLRVHQIRLQGGVASSDSYCYR